MTEAAPCATSVNAPQQRADDARKPPLGHPDTGETCFRRSHRRARIIEIKSKTPNACMKTCMHLVTANGQSL
jgi:hypothetical protein